MGNLAAFFLVEVMHDALKEISDRNMDPSTLFKELKAHEDADHKVFMDAQVPDEPFRKLVDDVSDRAGIDIALLAKGHNYCHTARLPSEIRHKGILTAHTAFGYDKGISRKEANNFTDAEGRMRLVRSENDQQEDWQQDDCKNVTLKLDYSDYFYANTRDGMKFITLPNDAEKLEYGNDKTLQGLLAICFAACPWNKCPRGDLDREAFEEGLFEVHVNGLAVDKMVKFKDCELLQHSGGFKWKPDDGRFKFGVRVLAPASFLRIGSFILW